jgi:hypothetical protein
MGVDTLYPHNLILMQYHINYGCRTYENGIQTSETRNLETTFELPYEEDYDLAMFSIEQQLHTQYAVAGHTELFDIHCEEIPNRRTLILHINKPEVPDLEISCFGCGLLTTNEHTCNDCLTIPVNYAEPIEEYGGTHLQSEEVNPEQSGGDYGTLSEPSDNSETDNLPF